MISTAIFRFGFVALGLVLGGCAQFTWVNLSNPNASIQADYAACQNEAIRSVPQPQAQAPAYVLNSSGNTNCFSSGGNVNCSSTGSSVAVPVDGMGQLNRQLQYGAMSATYTDNCLVARGWRKMDMTNNTPQGRPPVVREKMDLGQAGADALGFLRENERRRCESPAYAAIYRKSPCKATDITSGQESDESSPTAGERKQLKTLAAQMDDERREYAEILKSYGGAEGDRQASVFMRFSYRFDANMKRLYSGEITWGDYNSNRKSLAELMAREMK